MHIEIIGTVVLPLLMIFYKVPLIGWAKPTPVDPRRFKNLRLGQIIVSGAGPVSNLLLALVFTLGLFVAVRVLPHDQQPIFAFLQAGVELNVLLAIFNLVPLPPLDGSHVLEWALPGDSGHRYMRTIAPYGSFILLALVMTGALFTVLGPVRDFVLGILYSVIR